MASRPKKVKIGCYTYPVTYVKEIENPFEEGVVLGHAHFTKPCSIRIADASPMPEETFLHECLHAIFSDRGFCEVVGEHEEMLVSSLSCGLMQMLRDNKGLASWLAGEALREGQKR